MKKRTIIGIFCIILAIAVVFVFGPMLNAKSLETVNVIRLKKDVPMGNQITTEYLEVVAMTPGSVPADIINDSNAIVGQYAAYDLFAGDFLTPAKVAASDANAEAILSNLEEGQFAISVPISFQGSLSGKLRNGDIVRVYVFDKSANGLCYTPEALQYLKIITTTTGSGIDQDELVTNEDGSHDMPSTMTVLCNEEQAKMLAGYSGNGMYLSLVCRGTSDKAQYYLDKQAEYFVLKAAQEQNQK